MKVIFNEGQKIPIKSWCEDPEEGALQQALNLSNLPFAFKHVALMPDTHQGYGMPIGGVLATKDVIIPQAVGVDVGCGMCAVKTSLTEIDTETLKKIMGGSKEHHGGIRTVIPVGFNRHSKDQDESFMPDIAEYLILDIPICSSEYLASLKQIGTLGGGNHFIEIQKGDDGHIWIMIHSGSRNLGYKVANHYNEIAKKLNEKYFSSVPKKFDLAFLPVDSEEGQAYIREMNYCVNFAFANRKLMMDRILEEFRRVILGNSVSFDLWFDPMINIAHNYAALEHHFNEDVWVHRKGATLARENTIGIIPGSQGTSSYIVKGRGNPESFMSCSHGAGRKMSRTKAIETLDLEAEKKMMDEMGIIHSIRNKRDLDESASAYKDIDLVMAEQVDLVEQIVRLRPLAVIKG